MTGKLLGASLIAAAALWVFTAQLRTRNRQTQLLQELAAALDTMAAAIRWQRMAMPDILASLKRYPLAGPYFQKIEKQLRQGIPLQEAWHRMFSTLAVGGELLTALELTGDEEKLTAALLYTAGFAHAVHGLKEGLLSPGASLTVALYFYAKEQGEFAVAFAIAAILMLLTLLINLLAALVQKECKRRTSQ